MPEYVIWLVVGVALIGLAALLYLLGRRAMGSHGDREGLVEALGSMDPEQMRAQADALSEKSPKLAEHLNRMADRAEAQAAQAQIKEQAEEDPDE